jgi:hypothetical protein
MRVTTILTMLCVIAAGPAWSQVCELEPLDSVSTPGSAQQAVIVGETAYVAAGSAGIVRIAVADADQLTVLGSSPTQGDARDIGFEYFERLLVVADGASGVGTYAIQDSGPPTHIATTSIGPSIISLSGSAGDYLAGGDNGRLYLITLDADDRPTVEGQIALAGQVVDAFEHSRTAYCALGTGNGLAVVDVLHRDAPALRRVYNLSGPVTSVARSRDLILAGVEGVGVEVFRIVDDSLEHASTLELSGAPTDFAVWNDRLYMTGPEIGLMEADPSLGTEIVPLAQLPRPNAVSSALLGDTVLVSQGASGFSSVDASDCANPDGSFTASVIPAGARTAGASGSFWLTDVAIANLSPGVATANVAYLRKNQDNSDPLNASLALASGQQLFLGDVFWTLFGRESANGAIRITASHPDVTITSRTYNAAGEEGTYGQFIPAQRTSPSVTNSGSGALAQLRHDDEFRTNIGVVNLGEDPVDVEIHLYHADGTMYGAVSRTLGPYEMKQFDAVYEFVTSEAVDSGFAVVAVLTPGGRVHGYASVVDNGSNDPVYVPAQPLSESSPYN